MTQQATPAAPIGNHDVSTTEGGRAYLAEYFQKRLGRHDFAAYIGRELAGDFACALAKHLQGGQEVPVSDAKRFAVDIQGRECVDCVRASDYDALLAQRNELTAKLAHQDVEAGTLAERMKAAGMMTVDEMLAGAPLDAFTRHAGVNSLEAFAQWIEMRRREYVTMQAKRTLDKREDDDLYEWVLAHAGVLGEVHVNFKAAMNGSEPVVLSAAAVVCDGDDGRYLDWLLEGGIAELEPGQVLIVADQDVTDDEGHGELYRFPSNEVAPQ